MTTVRELFEKEYADASYFGSLKDSVIATLGEWGIDVDKTEFLARGFTSIVFKTSDHRIVKFITFDEEITREGYDAILDKDKRGAILRPDEEKSFGGGQYMLATYPCFSLDGVTEEHVRVLSDLLRENCLTFWDDKPENIGIYSAGNPRIIDIDAVRILAREVDEKEEGFVVRLEREGQTPSGRL